MTDLYPFIEEIKQSATKSGAIVQDNVAIILDSKRFFEELEKVDDDEN